MFGATHSFSYLVIYLKILAELPVAAGVRWEKKQIVE